MLTTVNTDKLLLQEAAVAGGSSLAFLLITIMIEYLLALIMLNFMLA